MRIGENKPAATVAPPSGVARRAGPAVADALPINMDNASVMGIPEAELTPKVRKAIMALMREVEALRREVARSNARLSDMEKLADQDSLVPMYNRRAFVREMSRMMAYATRYRSPTSLLFFDVNGLKAINDTHGHTAGDRALMGVATALIDQVRTSDVVGRLGGDEFGVLLAHADEAQARKKADQLGSVITARPLKWEGKSIEVGVAYGVYTFKPGEDAVTALAAADKAMYDHKIAMKKART